jgi:hypothetical protein
MGQKNNDNKMKKQDRTPGPNAETGLQADVMTSEVKQTQPRKKRTPPNSKRKTKTLRSSVVR